MRRLHLDVSTVLSLGLTGETDPSLGAGRQQVRPWGPGVNLFLDCFLVDRSSIQSRSDR